CSDMFQQRHFLVLFGALALSACGGRSFPIDPEPSASNGSSNSVAPGAGGAPTADDKAHAPSSLKKDYAKAASSAGTAGTMSEGGAAGATGASGAAGAAGNVEPNQQDAINACKACNGVWGTFGLSTLPSCNCRTHDKGKVCRAGKDCEGQ